MQAQQPPQFLSNPRSNTWWFILGHEPLLSVAEIFSVLALPAASQHLYNEAILSIKTSTREPLGLIQRLGRNINIAEEVAINVAEEQLIATMIWEAEKIEGKITFGVSFYDKAVEARHVLPKIEEWAKEIKRQLKDTGRSARYVSGDEPILNSATVYHNHLDSRGKEFIVVPSKNNTFSLAVTKAVQPLEALSNRDFGRPGRDDVSGMLPPKLAIMMINLAVNHSTSYLRPTTSFTLLDPFCGSGTILTEAMRLGIPKLIGTDISERAVEDTKKNVAWTLKKGTMNEEQGAIDIYQNDATRLAMKLVAQSVDVIVTEPYMGPPLKGRETPEQIKKTCSELADLYVAAFAEFSKVLKPGGSVVFSIPRFTVQNMRYTISDKIIPKLKELGFEKTRLLPESLSPASYILYHRPTQFVGREIWKFTLQKKSQ